MSDQALSIAEVLNFVNSFHEQCRNMVRDTARLLRDKHQIYLTHDKSWDYAVKPNDRFLEQDYSSLRRSWSTFVPSGAIQRGVLFYFEFFHPHQLLRPALVYGAVDPGVAGFGALDRWAPFYTTVDAEKGESTVTVTHDGPVTVVTGTMPQRFEEATLVRVPVETITDQTALESIIVSPLAALLKNERTAAIDMLSDIETELWPSMQAGPTEEEEDDSEEA